MRKIFKSMLTFMLILCLSLSLGVTSLAAEKSKVISDNVSLSQPRFEANNDYIKTATSRENSGNFVFEKVRKLSEVQTLSNQLVTRYAKDMLVVIPSNEKNRTEIRNDINMIKSEVVSNAAAYAITASSGNNYVEEWDASGAARVYSTVYYTTTNVGGYEYMKLTSVNGGFYSATGTGPSVGGGVYVTSHYSIIGQVGYTVEVGLQNSQRVTNNYSVYSRTWSYTPPTSWYGVDTGYGICNVGATYIVNFSRGTSTWTVELSNLLISEF